MRDRNCAIILFFIIGINEVYSLPQRNNLADHENTKGGHNDLYSELMPVNEADGGRVKRERPLDAREKLKKIYHHERINDVITQGRIDDIRNREVQAFIQEFRAAVARHVSRGETLDQAIEHFGRDNPNMVNQVVGNQRRRN